MLNRMSSTTAKALEDKCRTAMDAAEQAKAELSRKEAQVENLQQMLQRARKDLEREKSEKQQLTQVDSQLKEVLEREANMQEQLKKSLSELTVLQAREGNLRKALDVSRKQEKELHGKLDEAIESCATIEKKSESQLMIVKRLEDEASHRKKREEMFDVTLKAAEKKWQETKEELNEILKMEKDLRCEVEARQEELEDTKKELRKESLARERANLQVSTLQKQLSDVRAEMEALCKEKEEILGQYDEQNELLKNVTEANQNLLQKKQYLEQSLAALESKVEEAKKEAEKREDAVSSLEKKLEIAEESLGNREAEVKEMTAQIQRLVQEKEAANKELQHVTLQVAELQVQLEEAEVAASTGENLVVSSDWAVREVAKQLESSKKLVAEKEKEISDLLEQTTHLQHQVEHTEQRRERAVARLESSRAKFLMADEEIKKLNGDVQDREGKIVQAKEREEDLEKRLNDALEEMDQRAAEFEKTCKDVKEKEWQIENLQVLIQKLKSQETEKDRDSVQASQEMEMEMEKEIEVERAENFEAETRENLLNEAELEKGRLQVELIDLTGKVEWLEREKADLSRQIESLEKENRSLETAKHEAVSFSKEIEKKNEEIEKLKRLVESMKVETRDKEGSLNVVMGQNGERAETGKDSVLKSRPVDITKGMVLKPYVDEVTKTREKVMQAGQNTIKRFENNGFENMAIWQQKKVLRQRGEDFQETTIPNPDGNASLECYTLMDRELKDKEVMQAKEELAQKQAELKTALAEVTTLTSLIKTQTATSEELKVALMAKDSEISVLKSRLLKGEGATEDHQKELSKVRAELSHAEGKVKNVQSSLKSATAASEMKDAEVCRILAEKNRESMRAESSASELARVKSSLERTAYDLSAKSEELADLKAKLKEKEEVVEKEFNPMKRRMGVKDGSRIQDADVERLKTELKQSKDRLVSTERVLTEVETLAKDLRKEVASLKGELDRTRQVRSEPVLDLSIEMSQIDGSDKDAVMTRVKDLLQEVQSLKEEVKKKEEERASSELKIRNLEKTVEKWRAFEQNARKEARSCRQEIELNGKLLSDARLDSEKRFENEQAMVGLIESLKSEAKEAREKWAKAEKRMERLEAEHADISCSLEGKQSQLIQLQEKLSSVEFDLVREKENAIHEITKLQSRVEIAEAEELKARTTRDDIQSQWESAVEQLSKLTEAMEAREVCMAKLQENMATLQKNAIDADELRVEVKKQRESIQIKDETIEKLQREFAGVSAIAEQTTEALKHKQAEAASLQVHLADILERQKDWKGKMEELRERVVEAERNEMTARGRLDVIWLEMEGVMAQKKVIEGELEKANQKHFGPLMERDGNKAREQGGAKVERGTKGGTYGGPAGLFESSSARVKKLKSQSEIMQRSTRPAELISKSGHLKSEDENA